MYYNPVNKEDYDECLSRGICSISPSLSYLQELIKSYLNELSYYLLKLKDFGISNEKIKENVINIISSLVVNVNYSEQQFSKILSLLNYDLHQAKELYMNFCKENNLEAEILKSYLKLNVKMNISKATSLGQKLYVNRAKKITTEQKNLIDIIYAIVKSLCINLIELKDFGYEVKETYELILSLFNVRNLDLSLQELQLLIEETAKQNYFLILKLFEVKEEKYGKLEKASVSFNTKPGKAILVSGANLHELELLLEATKNKGVDVYTHGQMIMAHSFPKFKSYPNLVGHFGKGAESYLFDFAAFPGAVFVTKHSLYRLENFYRSRVFTTDFVASKGVIELADYNFEPLINAALNSEGFTELKENPSVTINLSEDEINKTILGVIVKAKKQEIKNFFFIGVGNTRPSQKEYFDKFLNLLGDDSFAVSFTYSNGADNVLAVNSDYCFPVFYRILKLLLKDHLPNFKLNILCTRCDVHTISNVVNIRHMDVNKIYFADCPPTLVNPTLIEVLREMFDLKKYTSPEADLKAMTAE